MHTDRCGNTHRQKCRGKGSGKVVKKQGFRYTDTKNVKAKCSYYRPGIAQRVGRGITLLFHDRGTRRWWVVSSTPRAHFTPSKDPVPILQKAGWAPGPVWTGGKSCPHRNSIPHRPVRSQSLYRLSYPAHTTYLEPEMYDYTSNNWSHSNSNEKLTEKFGSCRLIHYKRQLYLEHHT